MKRKPKAQRIGTNAIRIEGGAKSKPLPPERAYDGTPDPELGKMLATGATRYHLDTLRDMQREAAEPIELPVYDDANAVAFIKL